MSLITMPDAAHRRSPAARFFDHLRRAAVREGRAWRAELREAGRIAAYLRRYVAPVALRRIRDDLAMAVATVTFAVGFPLGVAALFEVLA